MSTNANINVKVGLSKFHSIYLHWDGYPSYALKILNEHYNTQELAEHLVSYGDLSVLAENADPDPRDNPHTFDHPQKGVCIYYGRDRGEQGTEVAIGNAPLKDHSYSYLFEHGEWSVL